MSAVSYKLPSPPESVFAKKFQDRVLESTGIELPKRRSAKSRVRQRKPHDFIHPIEKAHNPLFAYFQKEAERKEDAKCVFLLWGSRNSESSPTWAVDVQVTGIEDEAKIFQRLAQRYSAEQGFLQRYFSFREYDRLEPVTVCFLWVLLYFTMLTLNAVPVNMASLRKILSFHGVPRSGWMPCRMFKTARNSANRNQ